MTDIEALTQFWGVSEEEATQRSLHLTRELLDHTEGGGKILLSQKGFWPKVERIRFTKGGHSK